MLTLLFNITLIQHIFTIYYYAFILLNIILFQLAYIIFIIILLIVKVFVFFKYNDNLDVDHNKYK